MTSPPTRRGGARASVASALALTLVLATVTLGAGTVTAQNAPALSVGNATTSVGSTARTSVALTRAPNGVSGFNVTLRVENGSIATISSATPMGNYSLKRENVSADGTTAWVRAVDVNENYQNNSTDVPIARVTVRGNATGKTTLVATPSAAQGVQNDNGDRMHPADGRGSVSVTAATSGGSGGSTGSSTGGGSTGGSSGGGGGGSSTSTTTTSGATTTSGNATGSTTISTNPTSAPTTTTATTTTTTGTTTAATTTGNATSTTTSGSSGPGFGAAVGLAGLAGALLLARRD